MHMVVSARKPVDCDGLIGNDEPLCYNCPTLESERASVWVHSLDLTAVVGFDVDLADWRFSDCMTIVDGLGTSQTLMFDYHAFMGGKSQTLTFGYHCALGLM